MSASNQNAPVEGDALALTSSVEAEQVDVVVVGAGMGGIYAVHRFRSQGLSVVGLEKAGGVGGVWYHNRYPGARVDVDSLEYCYYFSPELFREWQWSERFATQPELLSYLEHAADRFDVRRFFRFNNALTAAQWLPEERRWLLRTAAGDLLSARFVVMTTGNLSAPRKPDFPGLDQFEGDWAQTAAWPIDRTVEWAGKRVAVIGTGSSGVQTIPTVARTAEHVFVFQRTPNFSVEANNGPLDPALHREISDDMDRRRARLLQSGGGTWIMMDGREVVPPATDFTPEEQQAALEKQWAFGGAGMGIVFSDQVTSQATNDIVAEFVRNKIRAKVNDPVIAEKLCPKDHPIGSRRLCVDIGYYETYNRDNVTLVDVREDPIETLTRTGIKTRDNHYEVDLIIFAIGFNAFTGVLKQIDIRNARGEHPTDGWQRGPRTLLGLMTTGFPNFFTVTGAGSPSVLGNLFIQNEHQLDWIGDCIAYMDTHDLHEIEPSEEAQATWTGHVAECANKLLRLRVQNYMVHVNDDGSRVFMPYTGGFGRFNEECARVAKNGYEGFTMR